MRVILLTFSTLAMIAYITITYVGVPFIHHSEQSQTSVASDDINVRAAPPLKLEPPALIEPSARLGDVAPDHILQRMRTGSDAVAIANIAKSVQNDRHVNPDDSAYLLPKTLPHITIPYDANHGAGKDDEQVYQGSIPVSYQSGQHDTDITKISYKVKVLPNSEGVTLGYEIFYNACATSTLENGTIIVTKLYPQVASGSVTLGFDDDYTITSQTDVALLNVVVQRNEATAAHKPETSQDVAPVHQTPSVPAAVTESDTDDLHRATTPHSD